jgi:hypothetical protein
MGKTYLTTVFVRTTRFVAQHASRWWNKTSLFIIGAGALIWFLIRVIPKPSRASYPCQQAAFPIASAFVIWLTATCSSLFLFKKLKMTFAKHPVAASLCGVASVVAFIGWLTVMPLSITEAYGKITAGNEFIPATGFDWKPGPSNRPIGQAKGIFPGRVVMTRNPEATRWAGRWNVDEDQWWLDKNTDTEKCGEMISVALQKLTGTRKNATAWKKIFEHYNKNTRLLNRGYQADETVAIKINLNNSSSRKKDNQSDASPQLVLALIRQLVHDAGVPEKNIIIFEVRRQIFPAMLTTVWREFKDVRFVQDGPPRRNQPANPGYGDSTNLEAARWVEGIAYSAGNYRDAKLMPQQIVASTYLINFAMLKLHSYPYNYMEDGDSGQTAVTMTGKNHFGSIRGTGELHAAINPTQDAGRKYSPMVDLEASPNLGRKTILYLLDGLYCGRKWRTYPIHFPNPPFNNQVEPYENPEWPACFLASLDGVALQSVGLDLIYAQTKNNFEQSYHNVPRIMVRDHADDFLREMATPQQAPSGVKYMQEGKPVQSLGVFEHWDNDLSMKYSRNIDPKNGKGIEFIYLPLGSAKN